KKGSLEEAIAEFRAALRLSPNEPAARYALATSLETKGELVTARKEYKKALKLMPKASEYEDIITYIRAALKRLAGAMR
ncbi:MAG: tetratricopeptide repeat protein, partial [Nitrospira sp.]|nr:tetratricopeptide repeat protein [Nitrospira sp.]